MTEQVGYIADAVSADYYGGPKIVVCKVRWNAADEFWEYEDEGGVVHSVEWPFEEGTELMDVEDVLDEMGWRVVGETWESTGFGAVTLVEPIDS